MANHYHTIEMLTFACKRCATTFCTDRGVVRNRKEQGKPLGCPNGHRNVIAIVGGAFELQLPPSQSKGKRKLSAA